jgi:hypothetical protein
LPREYADVERISRYIGYFAIAAPGFIFLPGRHFVYYFASALGIFYVGRLIVIVLHDRAGIAPIESGIAPLPSVGRILLGLGVAALVVATAYFYGRSGDPIFLVEAFVAAATLAYAGTTVQTRVAMGVACVGLMVGAGAFTWLLGFPRLILAVIYTAVIAWALLLKGRGISRRASAASNSAP